MSMDCSVPQIMAQDLHILNVTLIQFIKLVTETNGLLLQPYASCKKWKKDVESNDDTTKEMKKFEDGSLVTTLVGTVSQRLGFDKTLDIGKHTPFFFLEVGWV
jgi:hypothetical protein